LNRTEFYFVLFVGFVANLFGASVAFAGEMPAALQQGLESLGRISAFSCRFEQSLKFADGSALQYKGELAVQRPGKFRWHYSAPYEQLFVGNGKKIWHYEPDLMQVQVLTKLETVDPVVMRLLDGSIRPADVQLLGQEAGRFHVRLGKSTDLWLAFAADGRLDSVERIDPLGNRNRIVLKSLSEGGVKASLFTFTPPKGVEVVEFDTDPSQENR